MGGSLSEIPDTPRCVQIVINTLQKYAADNDDDD